MDTREHLLHNWLTDVCGFKAFSMQAIAGDASFRRYFRISQEERSWIAMDAPPDKENCVAFIAVANALRKQGLVAPEIYHAHLDDGLLLLTDFGDQQLLKAVNSANMQQLYSEALDVLATLQTCRDIQGWNIPIFTAEFMRKELEWFKEWFLQRYLNVALTPATLTMLDTVFDVLANLAASQPKVFMHRDYHSANLMVLPHHKIGVLDFQDAFFGPVTYDLVSLLRDCYIDWPNEMIVELALRYKKHISLSVSDELFLRWFDGMGLQRHMKALLTFSRKYKRDANPHYLQHIPRTLNYIADISPKIAECQEFCDFLHAVILPSYEKERDLCEE